MERCDRSQRTGTSPARWWWKCFFLVVLSRTLVASGAGDANRLTYLDDADPFYVHSNFPKLTTPQWIGEPDVDVAVILAIDDMRQPGPYEAMLRPILTRLKQIDGRAPVSIMCNLLESTNAQYEAWVKEGVSLEVHTLSHPCPILAGSNFEKAAETFFGGIALLHQIPGNYPVAFRTPCCDSIDSASPRLFAELFNRTNTAGQFLAIDSSVMNFFTDSDSTLPREWVKDPDGRGRFTKYIPTNTFTTTIENYPYPYVIGRLCWEFPAVGPSDWEAFHLHGNTNPVTVADWKAALDATFARQGTFTMIFHPHGWIRSDQIVELIDYGVKKYGSKIKFLNFREAQERMNAALLDGEPLRATNGQDNGMRLLDLNNDGFLDVLIGNEHKRKTRVWNPGSRRWVETALPISFVRKDQKGNHTEAGVRFGILSTNGLPTLLVRNENTSGAWHFEGSGWVEDTPLLNGLELAGQLINTSFEGRDRGVRFRDLDKDGICELIIGNESQNAVFAWQPAERRWEKLSYGLPAAASIVDSQGHDNGLRFVDINEDGFEDVIFSNAKSYSLHFYIPEVVLNWSQGWSREVITGRRGEAGEIPMITREGPHPNNGAWFHSKTMWVQNEDTAGLPSLVDRRTYKELIAGKVTPPKSPQESLASMKARPGFKVELVASEPLIESPVAFDWGADGKLWVVEMVDYPSGLDGEGKSGGIVRYLEDTNSSGHYNKSTVFLEGLNFPNGIIPWRKGVLVSAPPEIFYAEDTDGDGKADTHETLFKGFREGNQQHRANGFDYGLDNWLYGANGESGGIVRSARTGKTVNINGRDFRFRPDDGAFETQPGPTQFGRHRDDWGNWFGNNNASGSWHYFLPEQYLGRNPFVSARSARQVMPTGPESTRVYPFSELAQRFNDPFGANHLTSANSTTPYRDDLFGPELSSSYFVSEPVHNLVHREVLETDGVSFTSHRAADEPELEFLASADNWTRPTMTRTGPDGALYVADMYRLVIEHPEWIPEDFQKAVDLRAGALMGRIYRVYPVNATLRPVPRLDQVNTAGLVAALESANGWQRDTAQRLLVCAQDKAAVPLLEELLRQSSNPKTRLQALGTLDGLHAITESVLLRVLKDAHPSLREHAVRLGEPRLAKSEALRRAMCSLVADPAVRVRYQLAFSLGQMNAPDAARPLVELALDPSCDERLQLAILTSAPGHMREMINVITPRLAAGEGEAQAWKFFEQLARLPVLFDDKPAMLALGQALSGAVPAKHMIWAFAGLAGLLESLDRKGMSLSEFQTRSGGEKRNEPFAALFADARRRSSNEKAAVGERIFAIKLLGWASSDRQADLDLIRTLLGPQNPQEIRTAALGRLKASRGDAVPATLISVWTNSSPSFREEILTLLLGRQEWTLTLLEAIEKQKISPSALKAAQQERVLRHPNPRVRELAGRLFAIANSDRPEVLKRYESVARLRGDAEKGREYFQQNCIPCHRLRNEGNEVGADLGSVAAKPVDYLLVSILNPNQSVEARYVSYTALSTDGSEYTGIITTETANSITLRQAGGKDVTLLRGDLKELSGGSRSLMPDGFENILNQQAMADLIAYIRSR